MYDVVSIDTLKFDVVANELNLPIDHVKAYFSNFGLYKCYPIRDLTFEEDSLVKAINEVKIMTDIQLKEIIANNNIDIQGLADDQLLIERAMANYTNEERYMITRKYQRFILEPAVLYSNTDAPLTKPLTMDDIVVQLSNIAIGNSKHKEIIDARTRIAALSKISDIYTTTKMLIQNDQSVEQSDLVDIGPEELTRLIDFIQENHKLPEVVVEEKIKKEVKKKTAAKKEPEIEDGTITTIVFC